MLRIGITGGMGAGKSTISGMFKASHDIPVYDSDTEAKRLLNVNEDLKVLVTNLLGPAAYFGTHDGGLNRKYVGSKIFEDSNLRQKLQEALRPFLWEDFEDWCKTKEEDGAPYVIFESAILIESGLTDRFDKIIVVMADEKVRIYRLTSKRGVDEDEAKKRILTQTTDNKRLEKADYVIRNDHKLSRDSKDWWNEYEKDIKDGGFSDIQQLFDHRKNILAERIKQLDHKIKYISHGNNINES